MILGEMSDFGAGACDFHSDFASDFHTKGNDYAGDFGGEPRTAKHPPETPETAPPEQAAPPRQSNRGTRAAAIWQRTAQSVSREAGDNATP